MDDDIREFGERLGRHCLARMSIVTTSEGLRIGYWEAS